MIRVSIAVFMLCAGVAFIAIAGLGVARLPDVFQRMHSATKAGGIGSSLVMVGILLLNVSSPITPLLTIAFMLLTLSVSSQLLGRSAYLSGASFRGMERGDALAGVLPRRGAPGPAEREVSLGDDTGLEGAGDGVRIGRD
ncbi:MAG TPA: monovalent cation/H(+) antiporter subunit G [Gemmatimonadales bacterium]|nr:monovalent cation/H(+) antiporter subunit G [Gemmatimonadales bacterium]